jgi:RNA polymerase sigma-70 factor, ECF subfamily
MEREATGAESQPDRSDERRLVERSRNDPAAFGQLYELYVDRVFAYLRTYTDTQDDAADLTQHVFLRALEALPEYRDRGLPFGAWLFRIARNAAIDTFRRQRRVLPWEHVPESLHPISPLDLEAVTLQREALNQMRVLIARLTPEKQELLALRFAAGLSSREIAPLVGRSHPAVQKELVRIMHSLKEQARDATI